MAVLSVSGPQSFGTRDWVSWKTVFLWTCAGFMMVNIAFIVHFISITIIIIYNEIIMQLSLVTPVIGF